MISPVGAEQVVAPGRLVRAAKTAPVDHRAHAGRVVCVGVVKPSRRRLPAPAAAIAPVGKTARAETPAHVEMPARVARVVHVERPAPAATVAPAPDRPRPANRPSIEEVRT